MIRYNIERKTEETIGQHDEAVRCLIRSKEHNFVISGSWDQEISIWDPRQRTRIVSRPQNERVYAMDCVDNTLVVGTAQRKFLIWDLRNWGKFITAFRCSSYLFWAYCSFLNESVAFGNSDLKCVNVFNFQPISRRVPTKTRVKSKVPDPCGQMLSKWHRLRRWLY